MLIQEQDWHTFKRVLIVKPEVNSSVQVELGKDNDGKPLAYIYALWVTSEHRREGIGRELLHEAEKQYVEHGYNEAILDWSKANNGTLYRIYSTADRPFITFADHDGQTVMQVRQATEKGYAECPVGGCVDLSYPNSQLRRARAVGGGSLVKALTGRQQLTVLVEWE